MKQSVLVIIISLFSVISTFKTIAQKHVKEVNVVKLDWYKNLRNNPCDTTYILNFWATWCMPCVAELPYFDQITQKYKNEKVKVILISLDFIKDKDSKLIPFKEKKHVQSKVVLLDEPNYNAWINQIDSNWSGSLPATLIFNNNRSMFQFIEKDLTFVELDTFTQKFISK